jgi:tetratricopeptide (TPR) repeat protein
MPRQFAGSDLLLTQILEGDIGVAQTTWPSLWERAAEATAWTTWLIAGRLAYSRAIIDLQADASESAADWADRAIQIARRTKRRKYEALSLEVFGQALAKLGHREEGMRALTSAVELADELIGPPARWRARASLGRVATHFGDDNTAARAYEEASNIVQAFLGTLAPERQARLLTAPDVDEIVSVAGRPVA